jgi:hypothetical protein
LSKFQEGEKTKYLPILFPSGKQLLVLVEYMHKYGHGLTRTHEGQSLSVLAIEGGADEDTSGLQGAPPARCKVRQIFIDCF